MFEDNYHIHGDDEPHEIASRLSDWIFFGLFPTLRRFAVTCEDHAWEPPVLDFLLDRFAHSHTLDSNDRVSHFYYGEGRWVTVMPDGPGPNQGKCAYWWISTRTKKQLRELLRALWPFGNFAAGLSSVHWLGGVEVVEELRRELPS